MDRNVDPDADMLTDDVVALRKESVDRNANPGSTTLTFPGSLSARRAWIEIPACSVGALDCAVALRKESVDRNDVIRPAIDVFLAVALRKESMDRNLNQCKHLITLSRSLSARRAWIEIFVPFNVIRPAIVALRKESVDRNAGVLFLIDEIQLVALRKESVDRNLICFGSLAGPSGVALRKESVDRNVSVILRVIRRPVALRKESVDRNVNLRVVDGSKSSGRSPQGERG